MTLSFDLPMPAVVKYVFDFTRGRREMVDLLGAKGGAGLAEMDRLDMPVPPGFTTTTEACRRYLRDGIEPVELPSALLTDVRLGAQ